METMKIRKTENLIPTILSLYPNNKVLVKKGIQLRKCLMQSWSGFSILQSQLMVPTNKEKEENSSSSFLSHVRDTP